MVDNDSTIGHMMDDNSWEGKENLAGKGRLNPSALESGNKRVDCYTCLSQLPLLQGPYLLSVRSGPALSIAVMTLLIS